MRVPHTIRPALVLAAAGLLVFAGCSSTPDAVATPANGGHPVTTTISVVHTVTSTPAAATTTQVVTAPAETVTVTVTETETSEPEPVPSEEPPTGLTIGGAGVTASNDDGSATIKVLSVKRVTKGFGSYGDPPKHGNYLLIDVSYECTEGTFDYNPYDWTVRDPEGRAYDGGNGFASGYDGPELHSGTLGKGSKSRGTMVVDAPKGALTLEYAPFLSAPAIWNIPA